MFEFKKEQNPQDPDDDCNVTYTFDPGPLEKVTTDVLFDHFTRFLCACGFLVDGE